MLSRYRRSECGQGSLESVGVIAVAAVLVAAVTLAVVQTSPTLTNTIKDGICEIVTLGQGDCSSASAIRTAEDHVPEEQCVLNAAHSDRAVEGTLFITASGGEEWQIENLSDGTSRLTRSTSGGFGAGQGAGFQFTYTRDGVTSGVAAYASASAMYKHISGEVFYADDKEEAKAILEGQQSDDSKERWVGDDNWARSAVDGIDGFFGGVAEHEDAKHDAWFEADGVEQSTGAGGTLGTLSAEVGVATESYLGTRHNQDGTATDYFRGTGSIMVGANAKAGGETYQASAQAGTESLVEVNRDKDGEPVSMRMTTTTMSDAQAGNVDNSEALDYTKRTTQIPLTSESDRDLAGRTLSALGVQAVPGLSVGAGGVGSAGASKSVKDLAQKYGDIARERGYVYEQEYAQETTNDEGFKVDLGSKIPLGGGYSDVKTKTELTDYDYWNGTTMVSRPGC